MRLALAALLGSVVLLAQDEPEWVRKSDEDAQLLLDLMAEFSPEQAAELGIRGLDDQITVPSPDQPERFRREAARVRQQLTALLAEERDERVRQDLEILTRTVDGSIRKSLVYQRTLLPYQNAAGIVFDGLQTLLDDSVSPGRRTAVLIRLRKYAGMEPGYPPITLLSEQLLQNALKQQPALLGPQKTEVERDIAAIEEHVAAIEGLLARYRIEGWQQPYARLKKQLSEYADFLRGVVLPRARTDFHLPDDLYALNLAAAGVDYPAGQLTRMAHQEFAAAQSEMRQIAITVARERNWAGSDYRDIVRSLRKEQLTAATIRPVYETRLAEIEEIIREHQLVTLAALPAIIRLSDEEETAQLPVPRTIPPPLPNNRRERSQFLLPAVMKGGKPLRYDDFNFVAASWTIASHELRPGHELQYDAMVRNGTSLVRATFAWNSTNIEGWGLYSEWLIYPWMPAEGKLISLQYRLLRSARAFLDPELQAGRITPADAEQLLEKDVVVSPVLAKEEVDRYMRSPGAAPAYFDGYQRMLALRREAEGALGSRFDPPAFHDFILSQGLLSPDLLREAVMADCCKTLPAGGGTLLPPPQ